MRYLVLLLACLLGACGTGGLQHETRTFHCMEDQVERSNPRRFGYVWEGLEAENVVAISAIQHCDDLYDGCRRSVSNPISYQDGLIGLFANCDGGNTLDVSVIMEVN